MPLRKLVVRIFSPKKLWLQLFLKFHNRIFLSLISSLQATFRLRISFCAQTWLKGWYLSEYFSFQPDFHSAVSNGIVSVYWITFNLYTSNRQKSGSFWSAFFPAEWLFEVNQSQFRISNYDVLLFARLVSMKGCFYQTRFGQFG